jgi:hypothetical protein
VRRLDHRVTQLECARAPRPAASGLTDQQWLAVLRALRMKAELGAERGEDVYSDFSRRYGLDKAAMEARISDLEQRLQPASCRQ